MEIIVLGVVISFNFLIIKWKLENNHKEDAVFDIILNVIITIIMHGTVSGMAAGMVASFIISIYFLISPPKFLVHIKEMFDSTSNLNLNISNLINSSEPSNAEYNNNSTSVYTNGEFDYDATMEAFKKKYQR